MSTNRQKSFIATLELDRHYLDILGELYETPILRIDRSFSGGFFTEASIKTATWPGLITTASRSHCESLSATHRSSVIQIKSDHTSI
ncbi:hypothetical protein SAMN04488483_4837 [Pseudomonas helmanticensis]|uniref:Uncharacterized protein n=1 Tax=Pseudomonas helmanticensis TaxID=1471381 RepID=A0ACD2UBM0_9PSED|nr:hypothetical protein [Pseudomonas helmanticensis]SMQ29477.1 hypothetical protein SAMN04488483_4837 [Pseudomonas helmanticensis]